MHISYHKLEVILISLLLAVAIFFRFWQIKDYVVFLGDEGRDMLVMRDIFKSNNLPFLGPTASVGGFYLGPIYYWMAAPFLFLWRFDPVGPSYMVALFGVATVFILYKFTKEIAGIGPAAIASALYAVAPLVVRYSRSSWNPNPLPFFSILLIYFLYLGTKREKYSFFLAAGACLGIAVQLHYLAVILAPLAALIVITSGNFKKLPKITLFSIAGFLITFSPFLIFELRHNFPNFRTILEFTTRGTTIGLATGNISWSIPDIGNIFLEYITSYANTTYTKIAFWLLTLGGFLGLIINLKNSDKRWNFSIALIWFLLGLVFLRSYKGQLYDYYFGIIFPAPFFLTGAVISLFWNKQIPRIAVVLLSAIVLYFFAGHGFYSTKPNRLIVQTENIADFVIDKSENKPYNFALVSNSNSDHAYRYFLEVKNHKPKQLEEIITDQLLILCESAQCAPLGNPLWEIAGFGRAEITEEWNLSPYNFKIYKLTHWPGEPSPAGKPAVKGI